MSAAGRITLKREGMVATILFDRPVARNAMTPEMYEEFGAACDTVAGDKALRVVLLRGAGGKAFVAGSDIAQFLDFANAEDGIAYERKMDSYLQRLAAIPVPTVAVIEGGAIGGGLNIAAACDLRIATVGSRFGVPIARTLGNCLSMRNYARLVAGFGESLAKRMLFLGELLSAEEAQQAGFLTQVVENTELTAALDDLVERLLANAPLTLSVSKAALTRLQAADLPDGDDLIRICYGSKDFAAGVRAFLDKATPSWQGQ
jgi:enoyl-CoA hydratase/carnithine racemase